MLPGDATPLLPGSPHLQHPQNPLQHFSFLCSRKETRTLRGEGPGHPWTQLLFRRVGLEVAVL